VAAPLKDSFGPDVAVRIAGMLADVHPTFPTDAFLRDALDGYDDLELTPRARQIATAMGAHLPQDFEEAAAIVVASLGPPIDGDELTGVGMEPFVYLPHVFWVAERGLDQWETSMAAQYQLTQRFSCEYSIRAFIDREPARTLARLREWAGDPNPHVRRLVSEGTRPRLPWAPRLQRFVDDPAPVIELLELLKDDPTTLVRRSVANNLNDIGKDHPDLLVEVCQRWSADASPERWRLIRHALRSAVKRADPGALELLGFGAAGAAAVSDVKISPVRPAIGATVEVRCVIANTGKQTAAFNVDLRVHFVKANGSAFPKVFKMKVVELVPGASVELTKSISLAQHSTRTHYPGKHALELVVNGVTEPIGSFTVRR
jgi:3-methyladenine DNA glycosylase AlkC